MTETTRPFPWKAATLTSDIAARLADIIPANQVHHSAASDTDVRVAGPGVQRGDLLVVVDIDSGGARGPVVSRIERTYNVVGRQLDIGNELIACVWPPHLRTDTTPPTFALRVR